MNRTSARNRLAALLSLMLSAGTVRTALAADSTTSSHASAWAESAAAAASNAADTAASTSPGNAWRFELNTWIWLTAMDGEVGVRDRSADVSASFADILDASDSIFAFSGRLELGFGPFAGFVDGFYSKLGVDDASGPMGMASVDVEVEQTIVDFGLMYRLGDWEPGGNAAANTRNLTLDLYAGARYSGVDLELDPANEATRSRSEDWFDPIVGAKVVWPFAEHWHLAVNGDVGGFGVESDLTWSATGVVGYDFSLFDIPSTVSFGYRAIGWDYTSESDNEFKWDIIQHGFILGLALRF